jgi:hypothetical protein
VIARDRVLRSPESRVIAEIARNQKSTGIRNRQDAAETTKNP